MRIIYFCIAVLLVGCSTVAPVNTKFPEVPKILQEQCEGLKKIEDDKVAITEMLKVVIHNYTLYHECSTKVEGWNEWYDTQKKIHGSIK